MFQLTVSFQWHFTVFLKMKYHGPKNQILNRQVRDLVSEVFNYFNWRKMVLPSYKNIMLNFSNVWQSSSSVGPHNITALKPSFFIWILKYLYWNLNTCVPCVLEWHTIYYLFICRLFNHKTGSWWLFPKTVPKEQTNFYHLSILNHISTAVIKQH